MIPADVDAAIAAFAGCRTAADFYRLQIGIENLWLPQQAAQMVERVAEFPPRLHKWIDLLGRMVRVPDGTLQPYSCSVLAEHVRLLRGGPGASAARALLVAFCGNSDRMMMPLCAFAQHVPAARFDIVMLTTGDRSMYLRGIPGYAPDLASAMARLGRDVGLEGYASVRCMGTSGGGAASLYAAEMLGASRALCVGGGHASLVADKLAARGLSGDEIDRVRRTDPPRPVEMAVCFGADHAQDVEGGRSLLRVFPSARPLAVEGVGTHNPLHAMLERGRLGRFLEQYLLADPRAASKAAPPSAPAVGDGS